MIKYLLFKLASIVVPWLPYPVAHAVSAFAGELAYLLAAGPRRAVTSNLRHILGSSASPAETARIARGVFRTQTLNYLDMFRIPKLSPDQIRRAVTVVGIEHYYEARARGKGIIVATAHYGNMDLLVQASLTVDTQVLVLVEPLEPPALFQLVAGLRSSLGITVLPVGLPALKAAIRTLRQGNILATAFDKNIHGGSESVPFFGSETPLPTGAVELALGTGATLLPAFGLRDGQGRYCIFIEPPLELEVNIADAVRVNLGQMAAIMEKYIRWHPEQWVIFEPVWGNGLHAANNLSEEDVRAGFKPAPTSAQFTRGKVVG